jgi:aspartyl-tRNA(Asn)/glutamyl-tRNA(Gln) amidotransferase subunit C
VPAARFPVAMRISEAEVRRTAALARLALTDDEVGRMARELDAILGYMEGLAAVDVSAVAPTTHAVDLRLRLRPDEPGPELDPEVALAAAPRRQGAFFEVPRVIAHDKGG